MGPQKSLQMKPFDILCYISHINKSTVYARQANGPINALSGCISSAEMHL